LNKMHNNTPMFNPGMYAPQGMMPNNPSFVMNYGGPPQNYGGQPYMEPQNMMQNQQREPTPGFIMKKSYGESRGRGGFHRGSRGRGGHFNDRRNDRDDNYQRNSDRRYRQENSYRDDSREDRRDDRRDSRYDQDRLLPSSKKISKNYNRGPQRRYDGPRDGPRYGPRDEERSPRQSYGQGRPMRRPQQELDEHHKALNSSMFYRTKMCPHLLECTKGPSCSYAHTPEELRESPNLKKTRLCQLFMIGKCNRGNMCSFAHGDEELRATPEFFKTSICNGYLKGNCRSGDHCRYAHGKDELRAGPEEFAQPQIQEYDPYYGYNPAQEYNPYQGQEMPNPELQTDFNENNNGNLIHSHVNRTMPMDPNYINNQPTNNPNPGFNKNLENMTPNVYASTNFPDQSNNAVNPRSIPSGSVNKAGAPQGDYPENIAFNTFNPEKINSLFSSNEAGGNF